MEELSKNLKFIKTSAKTGENVEEAFRDIAMRILED
jgi:translation initiation factor IF-2